MKTQNKSEVKYFSSFYVDKLFRNCASTLNHDIYLEDEFPFDESYAKGPTQVHLNDDAELILSKDHDYENCIILYEGLSNLTEAQAADERLWAYLIHTRYWKYMRKRWPVEESKKPISRIRSRYFLRSVNLETLTRNGLARLWWYAHLTVDPSKSNKYELLKVMMQRQDLVVGVTERAIGSNQAIRTGILEFFHENPKIALSQEMTRALFKGLNLYGGVKMLPMLSRVEIKSVLKTIL